MARWQEYSLGVAPQCSGFGTPDTVDGDFKYLQCDKPKVQLLEDSQDFDLLTGQIGAASEKLWGRKHGTISFSMPLEGLVQGYTPSAIVNPGTTGVLPYWLAIVANSLGSMGAPASASEFWKGLSASCNEYTVAGVLSAIATAITLDDATASDKVHAGEMIITAASATSGSVQFGFVKNKTGQVITLFEESGNTVNSAAANVYGSGTAFISVNHSAQLSMTMRYLGENVKAAYILEDCVCSGWKLTWESGAVPTIEFNFEVGNWSIDQTKGGLVIPDSFARIPQIVGASNGRATIDGTATCGLTSTTIEYKTEVSFIKCHSATQGVSGAVYRKPRFTVNATIPWSSSDVVYDETGSVVAAGDHEWVSKMRRGVTTSIGCYVGSNVGRIMGFMVPAARVAAVPQLADVDGALAYQLQFEAVAYTSDTSDTAETPVNSPKNSLFRITLG